MFNFVVKLIGSGIAAIIFFTPIQTELTGNDLKVTTQLNNPVTEDIYDLMHQGYHFRVNYYCSVIIRGRKVYKEEFIKDLSFEDGWILDGDLIDESEIQSSLGFVEIVFNDIDLRDNDEIIIYIKAEIEDDQIFFKSTGLTTSILWENYFPRERIEYKYEDGVLKEI